MLVEDHVSHHLNCGEQTAELHPFSRTNRLPFYHEIQKIFNVQQFASDYLENYGITLTTALYSEKQQTTCLF